MCASMKLCCVLGEETGASLPAGERASRPSLETIAESPEPGKTEATKFQTFVERLEKREIAMLFMGFLGFWVYSACLAGAGF